MKKVQHIYIKPDPTPETVHLVTKMLLGRKVYCIYAVILYDTNEF